MRLRRLPVQGAGLRWSVSSRFLRDSGTSNWNPPLRQGDASISAGVPQWIATAERFYFCDLCREDEHKASDRGLRL